MPHKTIQLKIEGLIGSFNVYSHLKNTDQLPDNSNIFVDASGNVVKEHLDFMRARREDQFPVFYGKSFEVK